MNDTFKIAEAYVEIQAQQSKLDQGFAKVEKDTSNFVGRINKSLGSGLSVGFSSFGGVGGILGLLGVGAGLSGLWESVQTFGEAERAARKLKSAVTESGGTSADFEKLNTQADQMIAKFSLVGEEATAIRTTMGYLATVGLPKDQINDMTQAAMGLAEIMGEDVKGAMENLLEAQMGGFEELEDKMPTVKAAATAEEKWAAIMEVSTRGLKQKEQATKDTLGSIDQMKNSVSGAAKSIGETLAPAVIWGAGYLKNFADMFNSNTIASKKAQIALIEYGNAIPQLGAALGYTPAMKDVVIAERQIQKLNREIEGLNKTAAAASFDPKKLLLNNLEDADKAAKKANSSFTALDQVWKKTQEGILKGDVAAKDFVDPVKKAAEEKAKAERKAADERATAERARLSQGGMAGYRGDVQARLDAMEGMLQNYDSDAGNRDGMGRAGMARRMVDYWEKQRNVDRDIVEHGSTAAADMERAKLKLQQTKAFRLKRGDDPAVVQADYERMSNNVAKFYGSRAAAEEARLSGGSATEAATAAVAAAAARAVAAAVETKNPVDDLLLQVLTKLERNIEAIGGFR